MKKTKIDYSNNYLSLSRDELIDVMKENLSKRRLKHVLRVEQTALQLADQHNADKEKVSIAALSHDYAKERPDDEMRDLIISENLDLELLQYGSNIWHGPIGAVLMKNEYHLEDEEILEAINYHTIGSPKMSLVAKIIYVADFIEPKRSFKGIEAARDLADKDLDKAIGFISSHTIEHLLKRKNKIYPRAIETYNAWVANGKEEKNDTFVY